MYGGVGVIGSYMIFFLLKKSFYLKYISKEYNHWIYKSNIYNRDSSSGYKTNDKDKEKKLSQMNFIVGILR